MRSTTLRSWEKRAFLIVVYALIFWVGGGRAEERVDTIKLDWAYYNPLSLVLKEKGWLEEEFKKDGIKIEWAQSLGSNKALELLRSKSVDFGSTAGAAALLGRANGNPIKAIYVYSNPEWTALVTGPNSGIQRIQDLNSA
jgi:sulfonate transport system substrate-binding protein